MSPAPAPLPPDDQLQNALDWAALTLSTTAHPEHRRNALERIRAIRQRQAELKAKREPTKG